jgi:hypothetical protein
LAQVKNKNNQLKLGNKDERKQFFQKYDQFLKSQTDDKKTLLHLLAYEATPNASLRSLVKQLVKKYPMLMLVMDESEKTPLYIAINKKNAKLVNWMCENCLRIKEVLQEKCDRSENCLHAAIRFKLI